MRIANARTTVGLLVSLVFLILSIYCWYWAHSRGAGGAKPVEIPIQLSNNAALELPITISEEGNHDFELRYPDRVGDHLNRITGKAVLKSRDGVLAEADLPTHRETFDNGRHVMILFTVPTKTDGNYTLSLQTRDVPVDLVGIEGTVVVEIDPHYNLVYWQFKLLGLLFLLIALFCLVPRFRSEAGRIKRPFVIVLLVCLVAYLSGRMALGFSGLDLSSVSSQWLIKICFMVLALGPVAFVLTLACWLASSVVLSLSHWVKAK